VNKEVKPMARPPLPRVLIVDNDERVRTTLQTILETQGYRLQIPRGTGRDFLERTKIAARKFRPHVAIVDLRLFDDFSDEKSGLELLPSLQSAQCILYSAYLSPEVIREAIREYGATDWIRKHDSPQSLLTAIADAAAKNYAHRQKISIHWPARWTMGRIIQTLFSEKTGVPPGLVVDVLFQLFHKNRKMDLETVGGVHITSPPISRGRSVVLKVEPEGLEPVILKLVSAERLQREQQNYQQYVKDRLVGRFYAQLERTAVFWDLGGIVYSFIGSSLDVLPSFTAFYETETNHQNILKPLHHFFTEVWRRHYDQASAEQDTPLFQIYDKALKLRRRLEQFNDQTPRIRFPGISDPLTNPVPWLLQHANDSLVPGIRQTITHGDLHGDNLFVDGEHTWVIDFERTGPGHILRDFAELEIDIITRLASLPENDLSRFHKLALVLTEPSAPQVPFQPRGNLQLDSETNKALDVIGGLRKIAYETTHHADFREYYWGLLFDAIFVACLASSETAQRDRTLLFSSVLCDRLQHWLALQP
jgi:DNA-binding NarL/FixJ family response regulator